MAEEVQTRIGRRTIPNQEIFLVGRNLSHQTFWRDPVKTQESATKNLSSQETLL